MILPELNLLIHAHNLDSPRHRDAREWWDTALSETTSVALPWVVILGFVRITTHRTILHNPWTADDALARVEEWLEQPNVRIIHPTARHAELFAAFLRRVGTAGT
jgi:toxin-antitoxin system PIN domain toxin